VIRWLEGNPVGSVLAGVAGGLVVIALLLGVVWSLPPAGSTGEADDAGGGMGVDIPQLGETHPVEQYAVVTERPVFNASRQPELASDLEGEGEAVPEADVDAPEVELAGVVITPSVRMVTLREKKEKGQSLVAFEGQPLRGDYGSWHVSRIAPREITLASGDGEELQLKLEVHDAKIAPPPKPEPKAKPEEDVAAEGEQAGEAGGEDRPMTRAEEIRQRIQERREELRRAAEEQQSSNEEQAANYRRAIQSMMSGRKEPASDDDEQE
jgi:hypothetical protein